MMKPTSGKSPRHTARGIILNDAHILLMERWRPGKHYFSIPGGGIEPGETAEEAVVREILEETTVQVRALRCVIEMRVGDTRHFIYLCEYIRGAPHLPAEAPESGHGPHNVFKPGWQPQSALPELPFIYWEPLRQPIINGLANGFSERVVIVSAP